MKKVLFASTALVLTAGVAGAECLEATTNAQYAGVTDDGAMSTTMYLSSVNDGAPDAAVLLGLAAAVGVLDELVVHVAGFVENVDLFVPETGATFVATYLTPDASVTGAETTQGLLLQTASAGVEGLIIEEPGTVGLMTTVAMGLQDDAITDWPTEVNTTLSAVEDDAFVTAPAYLATAAYDTGQHVVTPNNFHPAMFEMVVADPAFLIQAKTARASGGSGWDIDLLGDAAS